MNIHDPKNSAEAERIAAYQERKRLEREVSDSLEELHANAVEQITAALANIEGVGRAQPRGGLPSPIDNGMKKSLFVTTDPVGAKHIVTVNGSVASRIEGSHVRTSRPALKIEVMNPHSFPEKTAHGSYQPSGADHDSTYTVDLSAFRGVVQGLIATVTV